MVGQYVGAEGKTWSVCMRMWGCSVSSWVGGVRGYVEGLHMGIRLTPV